MALKPASRGQLARAQAALVAQVQRTAPKVVNARTASELGKSARYPFRGRWFEITPTAYEDAVILQDGMSQMGEIVEQGNNSPESLLAIRRILEESREIFGRHARPIGAWRRLSWRLRGRPNPFADMRLEEVPPLLGFTYAALMRQLARSLSA